MIRVVQNMNKFCRAVQVGFSVVFDESTVQWTMMLCSYFHHLFELSELVDAIVHKLHAKVSNYFEVLQ